MSCGGHELVEYGNYMLDEIIKEEDENKKAE